MALLTERECPISLTYDQMLRLSYIMQFEAKARPDLDRHILRAVEAAIDRFESATQAGQKEEQ